MGVDRLERVNSLVKRVIAESMFSVLQGDTVAPGLITVTGVACGKDLRDATVKVSVFGDDELKKTAIQHLSHHAKRFQQIINREVRLKFTPRLLFKLDLSLEKGDEVLAILNSLPAAKTATACLFAVLAMFCRADLNTQPGVGPGAGSRYATDAFPGFDREDSVISPEKKEPRWFAWINGPKKDNAPEQFAWAKSCADAGDAAKACRAYDALVREWPTAPEAPKAQQALADLRLNVELDYQEAFSEYKYLLDFYSMQCDFDAIAARMYQVAELMRQEGKTIMFFRFANTVDVRHAYEAVVLRAPGADFAPKAMLTIAQLREDDQEDSEAIAVYENLRNLHPDAPESRIALHREGGARMRLLRAHAYNRARTRDIVDFFKLSLRERALDEDARRDFEAWRSESENLLEDEAYRGAAFYDSRTRTLHSAISAYERYLKEYPIGRHSDEARVRLAALKEQKPAGGDGKNASDDKDDKKEGEVSK